MIHDKMYTQMYTIFALGYFYTGALIVITNNNRMQTARTTLFY